MVEILEKVTRTVQLKKLTIMDGQIVDSKTGESIDLNKIMLAAFAEGDTFDVTPKVENSDTAIINLEEESDEELEN